MDEGAHRRVEQLTGRQHEVLEMLANGLTNHEIATRLGITLDGAKYHVREIMARLEVDSRDAAVAAWRGERRSTRRLRRRIAQAFANLGPWWVGTVVAGGSIAALAAVFVLFAMNGSEDQAGEPAAADTVTATATTPAEDPTAQSTPSPTPPGGSEETPQPAPTTDPAFPPEWRGYASPRWSFQGTAGDYALVAADERGVVAGMAPADPFGRGPALVVSLDPDTGAEQWRRPIDCYPLIPALSENAAFVPCLDGSVIALSRTDGTELWRTNTGTAPYAPIAADGLVITDSGSPDEDHSTLMHEPDAYRVGDVVALDQATGEERWRFELAGTRTFVTVAEGRVYVGVGSRGDESVPSGLFVLELESGDLIWSSQTLGDVQQLPRVVEGNVFVTARETSSWDAATGTLNWTNERTPYDIAVGEGIVIGVESYGGEAFFGLDAATGEEIWSDSFCDCSHTLGVHEGRAIITIYTGQVYEIDPKTGNPRWGNDSDDDTDIGYTPVVVGGRVFAGSKDSGMLTAFDIP